MAKVAKKRLKAASNGSEPQGAGKKRKETESKQAPVTDGIDTSSALGEKRRPKKKKMAAKRKSAADDGAVSSNTEEPGKTVLRKGKKAAKRKATADDGADCSKTDEPGKTALKKRKKTGAAAAKKSEQLPSPEEEENDSDADSFFAQGGQDEEEVDAEGPVDTSAKSEPKKSQSLSLGGEDSFKVFLGNISSSLDEDKVRRKLEACGAIERFDMPKAKEGSPRRHAFVYFKSEAGALAALKLDGCNFHGMDLQVKRAISQKAARQAERQEKDPLTVFVTGLSKDMDSETLKHDFAECGKVEAVRMLKTAEGSFKGTAFVVFVKEAAVKKALAWNGEYYNGNKIIVRRTGGESSDVEKSKGGAKGKGKSKDKGKGTGKNNWNNDHDRTVFCGNVYPDATEQQLWEDFQECGDLQAVRMLKDKGTGFFKGAAFLVFKTQEGALKALEWNGEDYYGRKLTVSKVQTSTAGKGGKGSSGRKYLE